MSFGERLKQRRTELGLRQEDIGKVVHVGKSTVSQWEKGIHVPDLETVAELASYLMVSVDWLLGRTDDPHPPRSLQDKVFDPAYTPTEVDLEELLKVANIRFRGDPLDIEDRENLLKIAEILWNERRKIELDRRK